MPSSVCSTRTVPGDRCPTSHCDPFGRNVTWSQTSLKLVKQNLILGRIRSIGTESSSRNLGSSCSTAVGAGVKAVRSTGTVSAIGRNTFPARIAKFSVLGIIDLPESRKRLVGCLRLTCTLSYDTDTLGPFLLCAWAIMHHAMLSRIPVVCVGALRCAPAQIGGWPPADPRTSARLGSAAEVSELVRW